ncbi:helix-turn-helix domain-containing protein [Tepidamorphus sp. 3E244]|uniref:helix-turn-helix domain-containing protein n=1 Tax=Tepidamorphus sp. 3E244 TaxID=3385498 RepID=UPI0038FD3B02
MADHMGGHGALQPDAVSSERISREEIDSALRRAGLPDRSEAAWVVIENNGELSVIARENKTNAAGNALIQVLTERTDRRTGGSGMIVSTTRARMGEDDHIGMVGRLSKDLWDRLCAACSDIRLVGPKEYLSKAGEPITESALLLDGIMVLCIAPNAVRPDSHLMVAIQVPGDFVDLHGLPLGCLDHDVRTLTASRIAFFPHAALEEIMEDVEHARSLWELTMIDAAIHRHWTYRSGRLRALASMADFLCEYDLRMQQAGRAVEDRLPMPLMQSDLAEVTGLSKVHVSRVLKDLRDAGLCTVRNGVAEIHDRPGLRKIAGYDPAYLYLQASASI